MLNNHTRNQRRMYRIHKMEEQIKKDEYIIGSQQQQLDKYKNVIDKIKEIVENNTELYKHDMDLTDYRTTMNTSGFIKALLELLEEVE